MEREAEPYDERKVMDNIVKQGTNTIVAHLKHLKSHGEMKLLSEAMDYLRERNIPVPAAVHAGGCPGSLARKLHPAVPGTPGGGASALRQWPIQLRLINPDAEYFDDADLLVSADCVAHAHGAFHRDLLAGKILGKEATDNRRGEGVYDKLISNMDALKEKGIIFGASVTVITESR